MAIAWGSAVCDSSNCFRIGYEISQSPASVSNSTATVNITLKIYLQTKYYAFDSGVNWFMSGDIVASGSTPFDHNSGTAWSLSNITLLATRTVPVATSYTSTVVTNGAASVSGLAAIAGSASVNWSITTAKRPVGLPAAPTGCTVVRASDTQQNVSWTNTNPGSSSNPYTNVVVQRSTNGGSWATIATLGVVTSYQDKTTVANTHYAYRVYAKNGAGNSGTSGSSATIWTTPRAPNTPTATKNASGDIVLTWTDASSQASATEVWHAANGVWDGAALTTSLSGSALTYTHVAPNAAQTHQYRLRYKVSNPALTGPYSGTSNTVQLQAPPNAPSNLGPMIPAIDATEPLTLTWQHNPVDTTPQSAYEIQHRVDGGAWSSLTGKQNFSAQFANIAANVWTNGHLVELQVRTWGAHATASPWSPTIAYTTSARPTASINNPTTATFAFSTVGMDWTYFDAEGTTQSAWEAQLLDGTGGVLESQSAAGDETSVVFATKVADGATYSVRVRVADATGLWSAWDTVTFPVAYAKPPAPTMLLEWNEEDLSVSIVIDNPPEGGGEVAAVSNDVYRSIDGGPWTLVATGILPDSSTVDFVPALAGRNDYKVVAYSATPSSSESVSTAAATPLSAHLVLNAGPGFGIATVLAADPDVGVAADRERVLHKFHGRTYPVPYTGDQRGETFSIGGLIDPRLPHSPTWEEFKSLCDIGSELACYRDPDGRRVFISLGSPSVDGISKRGQTRVSVTADRVAFVEGTADQSGLILAMGLYRDEDGVPYFDPTRRSVVALDDDGQPYVISGE